MVSNQFDERSLSLPLGSPSFSSGAGRHDATRSDFENSKSRRGDSLLLCQMRVGISGEAGSGGIAGASACLGQAGWLPSHSISTEHCSHLVARTPRDVMLDALREHLGMSGTKKGCDHGPVRRVHACWSNGERINSCLTLAVMHPGEEITTIRRLGGRRQIASECRPRLSSTMPFNAAIVPRDRFVLPSRLINGRGGPKPIRRSVNKWRLATSAVCGALSKIL